jgi:carbon monoxide dehydrogenase subunit G
MLTIEGEHSLPAEVGTCWAKLTDPQFLTGCISNIESVVQSQPDQVRFKLHPGVSFVRSSLDVTLQIKPVELGKSVRYEVHSQGIGSSSDVEVFLAMEPRENACHVHWTVQVKSLGGLLKALPQGLVKASAQKVIGDIWSAAEKKI